ncbi:DoxX family protein [Leptospira langatensis]|uniref:DoxX family protein n=1 Tax=Leptospira langatensis TaxID=2484983 RepID=A0A5F1ZTA5_9LEPT|nr:DoxX family protein [Leptospira langatensis]TGK02720.1 DoxX family protein [Leptospira langatensis]TGL40076.1 DoxX family protein [Leptospira langatensis]
MSKKTNQILYWVITAPIILGNLFGAYAYTSQNPQVLEGLAHLGYPGYITYILGPAKGLSALALLYPKFPRLKEWAYAGITFNVLGAGFSHLLAKDPNYPTPFIMLILTTASYVLWRRLEAAKA